MSVRERGPVVDGARVLITGAASGMGALYARRAAADGARTIALWDIDADRAAALAGELTREGVRACAYPVDLASRAAIEDAAARTRADLGAPSILINNAGIITGAPFAAHDVDRDIVPTMAVNALAPMILTRLFLPDMLADVGRPQRILTVASAAGTLANPNMSVYAASKWALIGWSESVRLELEHAGARHIAVTAFCPSFVSTGMFAGARNPRLTPILTPEDAVAAAWRGMIAGRPLVLKPWTVKLGMAARGVLPTRAWDLLADRVFDVYSSMAQFTGRTGPVRAGGSR